MFWEEDNNFPPLQVYNLLYYIIGKGSSQILQQIINHRSMDIIISLERVFQNNVDVSVH